MRVNHPDVNSVAGAGRNRSAKAAPHPSPLPIRWGEGGGPVAARANRDPWKFKRLPTLLPRPIGWGEGRGEGFAQSAAPSFSEALRRADFGLQSHRVQPIRPKRSWRGRWIIPATLSGRSRWKCRLRPPVEPGAAAGAVRCSDRRRLDRPPRATPRRGRLALGWRKADNLRTARERYENECQARACGPDCRASGRKTVGVEGCLGTGGHDTLRLGVSGRERTPGGRSRARAGGHPFGRVFRPVTRASGGGQPGSASRDLLDSRQ